MWLCTSIKLFVSVILLSDVCQHTEAASIYCYVDTLENPLIFPLSDPSGILTSKCYNPTRPTILYTFGFQGKMDGNATISVLTGFLQTGLYNVWLLNWQEEASATPILGYSGIYAVYWSYVVKAVPNAKKVGVALGNALVILAKRGLDLDSVHLIGHSLGCHTLGNGGREARLQGYIVGRITGLDPAGALYEPPSPTNLGLNSDCGKFVDVIHTDPNNYGTTRDLGTVDYWPNYSGPGEVTLQPGCPDGKFTPFSTEDLCSHDRSWEYFLVSLKINEAFVGIKFDTYDGWKYSTDATRQGHPTSLMGIVTNYQATDDFYLTTDASYPYGKYLEGVAPDSDSFNRIRRNTDFATKIEELEEGELPT